jgi:hypothetical protein
MLKASTLGPRLSSRISSLCRSLTSRTTSTLSPTAHSSESNASNVSSREPSVQGSPCINTVKPEGQRQKPRTKVVLQNQQHRVKANIAGQRQNQLSASAESLFAMMFDPKDDESIRYVVITHRNSSVGDNRSISSTREHDTVISVEKFEDLLPFAVSQSQPFDDDDIDYRQDLIRVLSESQSPNVAWNAYCALLAMPRRQTGPVPQPHIPHFLLHRLGHLFSQTRPKTRVLFFRLLSVLRTIWRSGGEIHLTEWNALIGSAGSGWRKTRPEDFRFSLEIFNDMVSQREPGTNLLGDDHAISMQCSPPAKVAKPDIVTYTTLLTIAARTSSVPVIRHAISILKASGIQPNRITHLSLLKHFAQIKDISGVRSTLTKMKQQGLELGLDGVNGCLWCFGSSSRVDLASKVYRVLRHNVVPDDKGDIVAITEYLANVHGIVVPDTMVPDTVTYTMMIQILAYHNHFYPSLDVFIDMLSSENVETKALRPHDRGGAQPPANFPPNFPAFRALFLGFARHAIPPSATRSTLSTRLRSLAGRPTWTLENLDNIFDIFLALPACARPCRSTLYWIIVAFKKTSGNDVAKLRDVWLRLQEVYPWPWADPGQRLSRLRKEIFPS